MNHPTKVITGPRTVFSYLTVNEPRIPLRGGKPRYSASLIIPKGDTKTVEKIRAAIRMTILILPHPGAEFQKSQKPVHKSASC